MTLLCILSLLIPFPLPQASLSSTDLKALTLVVMVEAGGLTPDEKDIVLFSLLNREQIFLRQGNYATIEGYTRHHQLMTGFRTISGAYDWYSGRDEQSPFYPSGHPNFVSARDHVLGYVRHQYPDWTGGSIQFKHAESFAGAAWLSCFYGKFSTSEIRQVISKVAEPIINGNEFVIGHVGVTVYSNANITPRLPENAERIVC